MSASPCIVSTATAVPAHAATQDEVKARLAEVFDLSERRRDATFEMFDNAAVGRRFSVEPVAALGRARSLGEIQERYREHAIPLGRQVASDAMAAAGITAADVDMVISVSCTGIMIPSLDAHLANELGFRPDVRRLPLTELGCVGGAAALGRANDFLVGFPDARVLVVAVELPSLSLQRADLSVANLVSTALFGDGAAAAVLTGGRATNGHPAVRILDTLSHLFPRSTGALGFDLQDDGFHSVLSKEVPHLLKTEIARLVRVLAERSGLSREELSCFVLHPGGRKILDYVEEELGLTRGDTEPSWDVLRGYGNQSSASVLFVLHEWLTKRRPAQGAHGVLAAFGPGLSAELLLLEWS